jgi:curved DNA-binding protein CbpA
MAFSSGKNLDHNDYKKKQRARLKEARKASLDRLYAKTLQIVLQLLAERALTPQESLKRVRAFMTKSGLKFGIPDTHPESSATVLRRYLYSCKPSLTARRKFFSQLIDFTTENEFRNDAPVEKFLEDIKEELRIEKQSQSKFKKHAYDSKQAKATFKHSSARLQREQEREPDPCFKILECEEQASLQTIKRAYKRKALVLHPDKLLTQGLSSSELERKRFEFQELHDAYQRALSLMEDSRKVS